MSAYNIHGSTSLLPEENQDASSIIKSKNVGNIPKFPTVRVCQDCAHSFDSIFEAERQKYIAPYINLLQQEKQSNMNAREQLEEVKQNWAEAFRKWSHMANKIDNLQDECTALIQKNHELRMTLVNASTAVLHDHNYARI